MDDTLLPKESKLSLLDYGPHFGAQVNDAEQKAGAPLELEKFLMNFSDTKTVNVK